MARRVRSKETRRRTVPRAVLSRPGRPPRHALLGGTALAALLAAGLVATTADAQQRPSPTQLPTNGQPQAGTQATIASSGSHMTVTQTSPRGVINWDSFSIGAQAQVTFQQPGASSVTLNQVVGADPSVIAGRLNANGQLVLVNGAGVVFANGAQVNVGSLIAATARVANPQAFMDGGTIQFDRPSANPNAEVGNAGTITVRDGGLVGLVGPSAANSGTINARLGRVTIGGAETFTVDLAGDGLVNFQIGQPVSQQPRDAQGNKKPLASNTGTIHADGGVVTLTARAAGAVVDNVINVGGAIRARAVSQEGGIVVFGGEDQQTVTMGGTVDVSGKGAGQRGGRVVATSRGGTVNLAPGTQVDASGHGGGGTVNIGGSYQGRGPLPNARNTTVQPGAQVNADATGRGNGGTVIVWADNSTVFGGMISARGGPKRGDGGFVEVSGKKYLDYRGTVDLRATAGTIGRLLLDPDTLFISDGGDQDVVVGSGNPTQINNGGNLPGGDSVLSVTTLEGALSTADVVVNARRTGSGGGNIAVVSNVTIPGGRTLTLDAETSVSIGATISTSGTGANLAVNAGTSIFASGAINLGIGTLSLSTGGSISLDAAIVAAATVNFTAGTTVSIDNVGNAIGTFASAPSSAGGDVSLRSTSPLVIGEGGITTPAGLSLISDGALTIAGSLSAGTSTTPGAPSIALQATDIQQTGGSITTPGTLQAVATAGSVQLPPSANASLVNNVGAVTGSAIGDFSHADADAVTLGALSLVGGSGAITIRAGGDITIAGGISVNNETSSNPDAIERGVYLFTQGGAVRGTPGSTIDINPIDGNSILGGILTVEAFGGIIDLSATPISALAVRFLAPSGSVNIDNANNAIGRIGASQGGTTAGSIVIANSQQLAVFIDLSATTIDITTGGPLFISANVSGLNAVTLTSTAGGITQNAGTISGPSVSLNASGANASIAQTGGRIVAGDLIATALSGAVDLVSAANDVTAVSGSAGTNFRYVDANSVNLGIATTFDGSFGTVTVISSITVGAGGFVDIAANQITIASGLSATGPGTTETVTARIGAITGTGADNPTGVTVLRPTAEGTPMLVGGAGGSGLTQDLLVAGIRTGTLRVGSIGRAAGSVLGGATIAGESAAGAITVQGLDFSGTGQLLQRLVLESGAAGVAIQQSGPIRLTRGGPFEGALATAVRGGGSVELTNPNNSVTALAHVARESDTTVATQSGTFRYVDESSIPVISVAGSGTPLIGQRDSGTTPGVPANSAILTAGGDVTLVSRTGSIEFLGGLAAIGATARLSAAGDIFQSTLGGVVANGLLAVAGGAVDLSAAAGLNNVRFLSGAVAGASEGLGDFRLINAASVTVPAGGVVGDSLVATVAGVHAGVGATLELAIGSGDIVVSDTSLTAVDGLVLLRRVAGATGSEIILSNVSFDTGSGSPNLVVLDLTGSPALSSGAFATLKSGTTPPSGTSAIALGPNPDGGILLTNVNAANTTVYLVGGPGSTFGGSGTFGLLGVYAAHGNPIALTGSVRQIDPATPHSVTAPFSEPFDTTTFAGFYVRRQGVAIDVQTFNTCVIGTGICPSPEIPPEPEPPEPPVVVRIDLPDRIDWWPDPNGTDALVGTPSARVMSVEPTRSTPSPLDLESVDLVNQGNEYLFNASEEQRRLRQVRGGR